MAKNAKYFYKRNLRWKTRVISIFQPKIKFPAAMFEISDTYKTLYKKKSLNFDILRADHQDPEMCWSASQFRGCSYRSCTYMQTDRLK